MASASLIVLLPDHHAMQDIGAYWHGKHAPVEWDDSNGLVVAQLAEPRMDVRRDLQERAVDCGQLVSRVGSSEEAGL